MSEKSIFLPELDVLYNINTKEHENLDSLHQDIREALNTDDMEIFLDLFFEKFLKKGERHRYQMIGRDSGHHKKFFPGFEFLQLPDALLVAAMRIWSSSSSSHIHITARLPKPGTDEKETSLKLRHSVVAASECDRIRKAAQKVQKDYLRRYRADKRRQEEQAREAAISQGSPSLEEQKKGAEGGTKKKADQKPIPEKKKSQRPAAVFVPAEQEPVADLYVSGFNTFLPEKAKRIKKKQQAKGRRMQEKDILDKRQQLLLQQQQQQQQEKERKIDKEKAKNVQKEAERKLREQQRAERTARFLQSDVNPTHPTKQLMATAGLAVPGGGTMWNIEPGNFGDGDPDYPPLSAAKTPVSRRAKQRASQQPIQERAPEMAQGGAPSALVQEKSFEMQEIGAELKRVAAGTEAKERQDAQGNAENGASATMAQGLVAQRSLMWNMSLLIYLDEKEAIIASGGDAQVSKLKLLKVWLNHSVGHETLLVLARTKQGEDKLVAQEGLQGGEEFGEILHLLINAGMLIEDEVERGKAMDKFLSNLLGNVGGRRYPWQNIVRQRLMDEARKTFKQ